LKNLGKENFKIKITDTLMCHLQWRFKNLHNIVADFSFLSIYSLKNITAENLRKQAAHLALKMTSIQQNFQAN